MSADHAYDGNHITQWLLETESLEDFLQTLADAALELSRAQGAGLTLQRDGRPLTVVSSGTVAPQLDEKQYGQDDGPCLQSLRTGKELLVNDMLAETRWGDYPAYAVACGMRSSLSLPIAARTHTSGALNLYAAPPEAYEQADLTSLRSLAAQATGAIALAQRITDTEDFVSQLQDAMTHRSVIDQALGVIMGQRRCTAEEAFGILRSASQHRNVKLRNLCTELITNLTGQPPTAPELRPHR
ncbi:GAF and ANTAR domain-containing protein [Streptomyces rugosispiralis]|uniref:GAF and ANTAR domain-containing protein n=1 Tax=Streptomyces rugosispiralis TaxID=2967341 RepID=A0ABT1V0T5_9ACTN|nr:GAF and ANTAR domain-containing protein [Streptomyces rugosispiralis]MCQ8190394.1 GAF and ANTAR domain-containing protein [Streptomyces rugosispiralis]